nr:MAG TPA: hypothetical protein [Caudoviricetes sp.]
MAKAVLVMEITEICCDCRFCRELHEGVEACCELEDEPNDNTLCRMIDDYCYHKPDWCPLRELPEKANHPDYCDDGRFDKGFNACLDEILEERKA